MVLFISVAVSGYLLVLLPLLGCVLSAKKVVVLPAESDSVIL